LFHDRFFGYLTSCGDGRLHDQFLPPVRGALLWRFHGSEEKGAGGGKARRAEDTLYDLASSRGALTRNILVAGAEVRFSKNVGLQFAYTVGHRSPDFAKTETISAGLSVKF
jgi:hypothetical protein